MLRGLFTLCFMLLIAMPRVGLAQQTNAPMLNGTYVGNLSFDSGRGKPLPANISMTADPRNGNLSGSIITTQGPNTCTMTFTGTSIGSLGNFATPAYYAIMWYRSWPIIFVDTTPDGSTASLTWLLGQIANAGGTVLNTTPEYRDSTQVKELGIVALTLAPSTCKLSLQYPSSINFTMTGNCLADVDYGLCTDVFDVAGSGSGLVSGSIVGGLATGGDML